MHADKSLSLKLSVVILCYEMQRELPKTLLSLLPPIQKGLESINYEIVVVDNGSRAEYDFSGIAQNLNIVFLKYPAPTKSPVAAINWAISLVSGEIICLFIDGARLASPGILASAVKIIESCERAVVGTYSFHLGSSPQNISVKKGYNKDKEDSLLRSIDWPSDGYRLFDIASLDPSSGSGVLFLPAETNALALRKSLWDEAGGFNLAFQTPGGGLANLELWNRFCLNDKISIYLLVGEGTFHQMHGGVSTNSLDSRWFEFSEEYNQIVGAPYSTPNVSPYFYGRAGYQFRKYLEKDKLDISLIDFLMSKLRRKFITFPKARIFYRSIKQKIFHFKIYLKKNDR